MKDLIEKLRQRHDYFYRGSSIPSCLTEAADLLERICSQPVALPQEFEVFTEDEPNAVIHGYTVDQLTRAVQESTAKALETAAEVCDQFQASAVGAQPAECAVAIRRLIGGVK